MTSEGAPGWSSWPSPAKLNLFLHVTGRRSDGYHELQTVFQFLGWGDVVWLRPREDGVVHRARELPGVAEHEDLTLRAARALQRGAGVNAGVDIAVDKRIPAGGGLGGGSSNAASVLVGLNRIWGCDWSLDALADLGRGLGADVPVFVRGRTAWGEGIGERLTPLELPAQAYLVVDPGVAVVTREIFQARELTRSTPPLKMSDFLAGAGRNDCQPVATRRHAEIAEVLEWLGRWPGVSGKARMSGTGGCCFAAFGEGPGAEQAARAALRELPARWRGFVAEGVSRSPLQEAAVPMRAEGSSTGA